MSRDLQEGPTAAEIERDAAYYNAHRNTAAKPAIPTVAVFVRGGLVQDICFDGAVRVVVADFDCEDAGDENGIYTDPGDGRAYRVRASVWERDIYTSPDDAAYVRAALKAYTDPYAPFNDNEEERARIERELEEGSE